MKNKVFNFIKTCALSAIIFISGNSNSYAATLGISQTPLFLGSSVQPNVFIVSDDSGSMDWEMMMTGYWRYDLYDPDPYRTGAFTDYNNSTAWEDDGTWRAGDFDGRNRRNTGYSYIYGKGTSDNVYHRSCNNSGYYGSWAEECNGVGVSPFDVDWRVRSSGLNKVFYDPNITYEPWAGPCGLGADCADADFTKVRNDPYATQSGYGITRNLETTGDANGGAFVYEVWVDDSGYTGSFPDAAGDFNETGVAAGAAAAPNGLVDLWDSHAKFTVGATGVTVDVITYDPRPANPDRGLNETVFESVSLSSGICYNVLGNKDTVKNMVAAVLAEPVAANRDAILSSVGGPDCRNFTQARQDIANWYQYYRRRAFPVKNAISAVINAQPNFRYGMTVLNRYDTSNSNSIFTEVPSVSLTNLTAHNTSIKEDYYAFDQPASGTPLRMALKRAGRYFSNDLLGKADPIAYSCQKNFTILFTDGYWNGSTSPSVGDVDSDGHPNTVADVAYHFYKNDINNNPLFGNNVLRDAGEEDLPTFDVGGTRTFQHMVTFTVAFGVTGALKDDDENGNPDLNYAGGSWGGSGEPVKSGDWGPASSGPDKIDDLWHAAYNSAGTFASASTPTEVSEKLIDAISNIADRTSSAAAVALNSGTLNANSRLYQASFDSNDWSGNLKSVPIQDGQVDVLPLGAPDGNDDSPSECDLYPVVGELCEPEWNANEKLAAKSHSSREIFTFSSDTNAGVTFKTLADLGASQQISLRTNPSTSALEPASRGQERLDYIRGDDAQEGLGASDFRVRKLIATGKTKLGDIIHSSPAYIANPVSFIPNNFESASYNAYKVAQRNRKPVVYVGANDGMLHAFDASNNNSTKGDEVFAYIPGKIVDKLPLLTAQNYNSSHTYFVDGSPISFDAFDGSWKTLLAGSTGAGGQVVYGLDVTNPTTFGAGDVLWEFTDEPRVGSGGEVFGDVDLGYTIGDVSFARMYNGDWAVIFGNGFNNTVPDGNVSTTGNAAIYVVNAFTGELIKKFDTQAGMAEDPTGSGRPNGISSVTPIDIDGDLKADYLYAGDLFGNVWKMDTTSANPSAWDSSWSASGKPKPFHIVKDASGDSQPISTAVAVKRHPQKVNQTLVFFGTGTYFQVNDSSTTQVQTFYSIWDDNTGTQNDRSKLLEQEILGTEFVTGLDGVTREFRLTSSENIDPVKYKIDWTKHKGWFMDLTESGERVNVEPVLRGRRIIFVSLTPDADACSAGGTSWIMELDANGGSRLDKSPFDVNGDGLIDDLDIVDFAGDANSIVSGVRSKDGIVAKPGILNTKKEKELKYFSGTSGGIDKITESVDESSTKRQSWRQLR